MKMNEVTKKQMRITPINFYAYTYAHEIDNIEKNNGLWVKLGDTIRDTDFRMNEQGGASERQAKITVGTWENVTTIYRDYVLHRVLKKDGLHYPTEATGKGTEWFKLPVKTKKQANKYVSKLIDEVGGENTSLKTIKLRKFQKSTIAEAMNVIENCETNEVNIVANLCPRFGKTIWALTLFNQMFEKYGTRIMLLPAYWLSAHTSFEEEIETFREFSSIDYISSRDDDAEEKMLAAYEEGRNIVLDLSLHGDLDQWKEKYTWLSEIDNSEFFVFSDEADFGSHTDNQLEKTNFLFGNQETDGVFASVYASGTNIQRIAKNANNKLINGVLDVPYSLLEDTETDIIPRKHYSLRFDNLYETLETQFMPNDVPSWNKIWSKPNKCNNFITDLFKGITGSDKTDMLAGINLSAAAEEDIQGIMAFMSIDKKPMEQALEIIRKAIPDWKVVVLNGDKTSNRKAQQMTKNAIRWAKEEGKQGIMILTNTMGSRSYSISEIQAAVVMYDNGSADATLQKTSRPLTPGVKWNGEKKEIGHIFTFSFDANRMETIEKLLIAEAVQLQRADKTEFAEAVTNTFKSMNIFRVDADGDSARIQLDEMFEILEDSENLLKIADVSVNLDNLCEDAFDILSRSNALSAKQKKTLATLVPKAIAKDTMEKSDLMETNEDQQAAKVLEKMVNEAIRSINRSATTVYNITMTGKTYRDCLVAINNEDKYQSEFTERFGITSDEALQLVDMQILNTPILDVVVQNSKKQDEWS